MTVLGDLAQSTGPWGRDSWDDVIWYLEKELPSRVVELKFGYRVPRQIFELAARVLESAVPGITPPTVVRDGPSSPKLVHVPKDERPQTAVDAARDYAASGRLVGMICANDDRPDLEAALRSRDVKWSDARNGSLGAITLLSAAESKGLEFDAVVLVEPEKIVKEDAFGYRLLYVALTRPTRDLTIVHTGLAVPTKEISLAPPAAEADPPAPATAIPSDPVKKGADILGPMIQNMAQGLAEQIRQLIQPELRHRLLEELRAELEESEKEG